MTSLAQSGAYHFYNSLNYSRSFYHFRPIVNNRGYRFDGCLSLMVDFILEIKGLYMIDLN
jgi:hypothetical protein